MSYSAPASTYSSEITAKQITFLTNLLDEATALLARRETVTGCEWPEATEHVARIRGGMDLMTRKEASAAIDTAMDNNKQLRTELEGLGVDVRPQRERRTAFVAEVGIYRVGDRIFKVLPSRESSRHYAKELVGFHWEDGRPVADDQSVNLKFQYAKGAMALIGEEHRLSPEAERQFGKLIGFCIACGKLLTDPRSIDWGKGPKCSDNYNH